MKWVMLLSSVMLITGCARHNVVEYQQVATSPLASPVAVYNLPQPLDVTATTINYY